MRANSLVAQLFVVALFMIIATAESTHECGVNFEWNTCGVPRPCEPTCIKQTDNRCIHVCNAGCYCKTGYIREHQNGSCILETKCPKTVTTE